MAWDSETSSWVFGPELGVVSVKPGLVMSSDGSRLYMLVESSVNPPQMTTFFAHDQEQGRTIPLAELTVQHVQASCDLIRYFGSHAKSWIKFVMINYARDLFIHNSTLQTL